MPTTGVIRFSSFRCPSFSAAHEMMEYVYNVADVAYPVSIRDQMNRSRWLVTKAYDLGFFGPARDIQHRGLLVCGAGAAASPLLCTR